MIKNKPFYIFTSFVFFALLLPFTVQEGMFLDGVFYANISRNLAVGMGDIWSMQYSLTQNRLFCGHPFLVFWIQSFFFKLLGDSFLTERFFTLINAILSAGCIHVLWQTLFPNQHRWSFSWLPIFLWLTIPLTFWAYRNNILENTLTIFTLLSTICIIKAIDQRDWRWWLISGFWMVAAFLSKGLVGLFPLAIPLIYGVVINKTHMSTLFLHTVSLVGAMTLFSLILILLFPEALDQLTCYMNTQVLPSLKNELEVTVESRFSIVYKLLLELIFPIFLVLLFLIKYRKSRFIHIFPHWRKALFLLLIGMAASLPIMVSLKQRKFYLLPSIPYYTMAVSALLLPFIEKWINNFSSKWVKRLLYFSRIGLILLVIICGWLFGGYSRYEDKISDIYTISESVPKQTIVSVPVSFLGDYSFSAYMNRVGQLSVEGDTDRQYRLTDVSTTQDSFFMKNYTEVPLDLKKYRLYKRK